MSDALYIVDIIGTIVDKVRESYLVNDADAPYYMYGHPLEIINTLAAKENNGAYKFKKYPLIALFQDFEEEKGADQSINSSVSLNIVICVNSTIDFNSAERYTNSFKTVLYPLYNLLLDKISDSNYVNVTRNAIPHIKIDRVFWGKAGLYGGEANIFNDIIDAIEIQNLQLDFYNNIKIC